MTVTLVLLALRGPRGTRPLSRYHFRTMRDTASLSTAAKRSWAADQAIGVDRLSAQPPPYWRSPQLVPLATLCCVRIRYFSVAVCLPRHKRCVAYVSGTY